MDEYVQNTLELDETCTYDKTKWMGENLTRISDQYRKGRQCNYETFLRPEVVKEALQSSYDDQDRILRQFGPNKGLWKPDKFDFPIKE